MYHITIHQGNIQRNTTADAEESLLQVIRKASFDITAPCGGNGTCGKCRVKIEGEDYVTACQYRAEKDLVVSLPDEKEAQILTAQHTYTLNVKADCAEIDTNVGPPHGIAIDIGTTSLVFYLIDLTSGAVLHTRGVLNPQVRYGADVISRIQYSSQDNGLANLQGTIVDAINTTISYFGKMSGIEANQIQKIAIAGNTTMLHLLLGVDPASIAMAPFTPKFTDKKVLIATDLKINISKEAEIHILPSVSAYVGADIVAGLASLSPPASIKNYLYLDIGTNGEMALVNGEKVYCCSTAAGPAFEGANIECGMAAFDGAISAFSSPDNYITIGERKSIGICGSGLIDIVAWMLDSGLIDEAGTLEETLHITPDKKVYVSQQDIREIQLAKAAIAAGISILIKTAGLAENELDALFLAGGFGNYISVQSAVRIGLLPKTLKEKVIPIGNASGTGTCLSLRSSSFDMIIDEVLANTQYIELSSHEDFVVEYAMQMNF